MIVVDVQALQSPAYAGRGIARYVGALVEAIERRHPGIIDVVAYRHDLAHHPDLDRLPQSIERRSTRQLRGTTADLLHVASPFEPDTLDRCHVAVRPTRLVASCYDLIPQRFPERYLTDPVKRAANRTRQAMLLIADAVVVDSQSAADDIHELVGVDRRRLHVIGGGADARFTSATEPLETVRQRARTTLPQLAESFIMCPTGIDWRKNNERMIAAYAALSPAIRMRYQLVMVCAAAPEHVAELRRLAVVLGVPDVVFSGHVSDQLLVELYQLTDLVCVPSLYEGFGLPIIEAQACGAPVVCSNTSSLIELVEDPADRFDPYDSDEMAAVIARTLADPQRLMAMRRRRPTTSWDAAADATAAVYRNLLDQPRPALRRRRPPVPLAVATLLDPSESGVAEHSARLLDEMAALTSLVCYVPTPLTVKDRGYPVRPLGGLVPILLTGGYSTSLTMIGNHRWHRPLVEVVERAGGWAFLHDVRLRWTYCDAELADIARRWYPELGATPSPDDALWLRPIADAADGLMCQSLHAAELVHLETGVGARMVGPHPFAAVGPAGVPVATSRPVIISAGLAARIKGSDIVVEALRLVRQRVLGAETVIVGEVFDVDVPDAPGFLATGRVSGRAYDEWILRATVAVQLRTSSNGESSGAVADCLARGVPTIVSDIGTMAELPDDVVVKVPVGCDAAQLADVIIELVGDVRRRSKLHRAALEHSRRQTYRQQAERVLDALGGGPPAGTGHRV